MSTELQEPQGVEAAQAVFDEFRATQDECGEFFGGMFDELHSLSAELVARQRNLESSAASRKRSAGESELLASCRDDFRRAVEQLQHFSSSLESQINRLTVVATEIAAAQADLLHGRLANLPRRSIYDRHLDNIPRTPDIP